MTVPATTGQLRTKIEDMQIGDYIACNYTASNGAVGTFSNLGTEGTEIPVSSSAAPNGTFYFVKVAKGLLVADRVVQVSISWDTLNAGKFIEGKTMTLGTTSGILRSLTGGVAYADENGNKSLTEQGYGGWPTNNEWDKYIVNFPQDKIHPGKTLDDVFHWMGVASWCQDTAINGMQINKTSQNVVTNSTRRICRGSHSDTSEMLVTDVWATPYGYVDRKVGFRPVLEYKEG